MTTITKRLLILQGALLLGMGSFLLLPKYHGSQPVGIALSLPADVGVWHGEDKEVTEKEKQVLGVGTEFARKLYTTSSGAGLYVSIVLSGQDVNTSLHRPERCLPAQGWTPIANTTETIALDNGKSIQATRLVNQSTTDVNNHQLYSVYYYWFVGCTQVVASPRERSMIDWRDRLFHGYNQRWAYITIAANLRNDSEETKAAADDAIKGFVAELFPKIWKPAIPQG
jgi:EpsI family protein